MKLLQRLPYLFRPYVNADERRAAALFSRVRESDSEYAVKDRLVRLVQQNAAAVNLWGEYRYKGYKYLTKSMRRRMYSNLERIRTGFESFAAAHTPSEEEVVAHVAQVKANTVLARSQPEKLAFLSTIMQFLQPARGLYAYHQSSSFGRLLQDPATDVLEGDCNQIVTLYIYLYATRYPVSDLQLVTYPGHVALHFQGVDIEATNATFTYHEREDRKTVPVQEIVSINLLDTSDSYFVQNKIPAETFVQAARLAYLVSSERKLVEKNLQAAYHNAVGELVRQDRYKTALKYAQLSREHDLLQLVGYNGAVHFMKNGQFKTAHKFAAHTSEAGKLNKTIAHNEGVHYYQAKKYHEAIKAFQRGGETDMVHHCYEALYVEEQKALKNVRTVNELKAHGRTLARMKDYARKSGSTQLMEHVSKLERQRR